MKRTKSSLYLLLMVAVVLVSCAGNGIRNSASKFIYAINKMDLATAKQYSSPDTGPMMDQMMQQIKNLPPDRKKAFDDEIVRRSKITFTIKDVKERGDRATVTYTSSEDPTRTDSLPMVKQNGKWLADLKAY